MGEIEVVDSLEERDFFDELMESRGHVPLPVGALTVQGYIDRVLEAGGEELSHPAALVTLKEEMRAGKLEGRKVKIGGRQRWIFWPRGG